MGHSGYLASNPSIRCFFFLPRSCTWTEVVGSCCCWLSRYANLVAWEGAEMAISLEYSEGGLPGCEDWVDRPSMRGRGALIEDCYIPSAGLCAYRK